MDGKMIDVCMNGWIHRWMDECQNEWMNAQMNWYYYKDKVITIDSIFLMLLLLLAHPLTIMSVRVDDLHNEVQVLLMLNLPVLTASKY